MMKYLLPLIIFCGTVLNAEVVRMKAEIWPFEDHFYIEIDGHLYFVQKLEHSINCNCMDSHVKHENVK